MIAANQRNRHAPARSRVGAFGDGIDRHQKNR
jgi:hypothetical protein